MTNRKEGLGPEDGFLAPPPLSDMHVQVVTAHEQHAC